MWVHNLTMKLHYEVHRKYVPTSFEVYITWVHNFKIQMKQIILSIKIKNNKIVYKHVDNMYIFSNNYYIYISNVPKYIKKKKMY